MGRFKPRSNDNPTPDSLWEDTWKELCTNPDGTLNLEAIKNELYDYSFLLDQVPEAYYELSGGRISKPNTYAFEVIQANHDYINEYYDYREDDSKPTNNSDTNKEWKK